MSFDHLNDTNITNQSEKEHVNEFYDYQIRNMYDKEKYINPHDIAGQPGLVTSQAVELEKKKVQFRMANEIYLRKHPELSVMLSIFLFRVLEEKPDDVLMYAGKFFDQQYIYIYNREHLEQVILIQKKHYLENGNATA
ncbi:unnamed protein product (macronuclear) [Paramecium tetraurelia]|uniref:RIIa domain-containing protein n=1 Tax=Paramecium tetraurelia TaxID=5888 RepID=A0E5F1_PARTE|nr:uncharacterized protein GSPATT00003379001 [Paramecium tetraurelia]CAK90518.1 unnamed protein product [Paramecium tetraurelia]|eukprot:XP_001457915.1 hypothetical protein (macronuclear) [Paramecium tetraurelia strain d4-2]